MNCKRRVVQCRTPPFLLVLIGWPKLGMSNLSLVRYVQMCKHFQVTSHPRCLSIATLLLSMQYLHRQQCAVLCMQHDNCGSESLQDTFSAPQLLLLLSGPIPSHLMLLLNLCFQTHKKQMTLWVLKKSSHPTQRLVCTCKPCTFA